MLQQRVSRRVLGMAVGVGVKNGDMGAAAMRRWGSVVESGRFRGVSAVGVLIRSITGPVAFSELMGAGGEFRALLYDKALHYI